VAKPFSIMRQTLSWLKADWEGIKTERKNAQFRPYNSRQAMKCLVQKIIWYFYFKLFDWRKF